MKKKINISINTCEKKYNFQQNEYILNKKNQISIINQIYLDDTFPNKEDIINILKKKISGYKNQDVKKNRYTQEKFITFEDLLEKLVLSKLRCKYCYQDLLIIYKDVRAQNQWTLDRIDNNIEHTKENTVISCLKCNIQRGRLNEKKFRYTKQMRIIKKY